LGKRAARPDNTPRARRPRAPLSVPPSSLIALASPRPPVSRRPRPRRRRPDSHLTRAARLPTASRCARPSPHPRRPPSDRVTLCPTVASPVLPVSQPPRRPRRHPDRFADPTTVPTEASPIDAAPPSTVPAPVSRCSSAASRAPAPCRRRLAEQRHRALRRRATCTAHTAPHGPAWPWAEHAGRARAVRLGRAVSA
jgi:hypothetical protein